MKLQINGQELLMQMNKAIQLSPYYAEGMSAVLIGEGGVAIHKDGELLDSRQAKDLLTSTILSFSLTVNY